MIFLGYDMNNFGFESDMYKDPYFNPLMQYEQGYMYYRYLSQQLDYKIKCKEYEKLVSSQQSQDSKRRNSFGESAN